MNNYHNVQKNNNNIIKLKQHNLVKTIVHFIIIENIIIKIFM